MTGAAGGLIALRELELGYPLRLPGGALWSGDVSGLSAASRPLLLLQQLTLRQCELDAGASAAAPRFAPRLLIAMLSIRARARTCPSGDCGAGPRSGRRRGRRRRRRCCVAATLPRW